MRLCPRLRRGGLVFSGRFISKASVVRRRLIILTLDRKVMQSWKNEKVEGDSCRFLCICWKRKEGISDLDTNPPTSTNIVLPTVQLNERCSAIIEEHIKLPHGCTFSSVVLTQLASGMCPFWWPQVYISDVHLPLFCWPYWTVTCHTWVFTSYRGNGSGQQRTTLYILGYSSSPK